MIDYIKYFCHSCDTKFFSAIYSIISLTFSVHSIYNDVETEVPRRRNEETMNTNDDLLTAIRRHFPMDERDVQSYSALTLAYLGDAVYEIIIRTLIVEEQPGRVKALHKHSSRLVNARAQAKLLTSVLDSLSDEELSIYKRGRNTKSHSVAKNADIHDYRIATGFEALIGYLYLNGEMERCLQIIRQGLPSIL